MYKKTQDRQICAHVEALFILMLARAPRADGKWRDSGRAVSPPTPPPRHSLDPELSPVKTKVIGTQVQGRTIHRTPGDHVRVLTMSGWVRLP